MRHKILVYRFHMYQFPCKPEKVNHMICYHSCIMCVAIKLLLLLLLLLLMHQSDIQTCTDTKETYMKLCKTPFTLSWLWGMIEIIGEMWSHLGMGLYKILTWFAWWIMEKFWTVKELSQSTRSHSIYGDCIRSHQIVSKHFRMKKVWSLITLIGISLTPCSNEMWKHYAASSLFYMPDIQSAPTMISNNIRT